MFISNHKWHENLENLESLESLEKLENHESLENLENLETIDVRGPSPALVAPGQGPSKRLELLKTLNP